MAVIPDAEGPLAIVRPRVLPARGEGSEPTLLTELVARWLERGKPQGLLLVGVRGSGLTTALAHVAREFAQHRELAVADESSHDGLEYLLKAKLRVIRAEHAHRPSAEDPKLWELRRLAPWTADDRIEY